MTRLATATICVLFHQEHDEEPEEDAPEPKTKAELYALFKGRGPIAMVREFMATRDLQNLAIVVCHISQPLEDQFYKDQQEQSSGNYLGWAVNRARGTDHWWATVCSILETCLDSSLSERLGHTPAPLKTAARADGVSPWLLGESRLMKKALDFALVLSSHHFWSNMLYRWTLPHALPAYLIADAQERKDAVNDIRMLVEAVIQAEATLQGLKPRTKQLLRELMSDLGWNEQQLAREAMAYLVRTDFAPDAPEPRALARKICGSSHSTWGVMESAFSYLQYPASSQCKNDKMNEFTSMAYTILSPFAEAAGLPQVFPQPKDWLELFSPSLAGVREKAQSQLTSVNATTMPDPVGKKARDIHDNTQPEVEIFRPSSSSEKFGRRNLSRHPPGTSMGKGSSCLDVSLA